MSTLITGGTGFVGKKLVEQLRDVTLTSRSGAKSLVQDNVNEVIGWDPQRESLDLGQRKFDSVVNLMGEPIAEGRWNAEKKNSIRDSRVDGTRRLVDAIISSGNFPKVMVSASAIGFYGDRGDEVLDEDSPAGTGFLVDVCQQWEAESLRLTEHGVRVVNLRIGIVLGAGGALKKMVPIFKACLGGRLGSGQQWMAWIHVADLVSMIKWSLDNDSVHGAVNATAPNPVRNGEFTKQLATALGRPAIFPVPGFMLSLAVGEFGKTLLFSQRVIPAAALAHGFRFAFANLKSSLRDLV